MSVILGITGILADPYLLFSPVIDRGGDPRIRSILPLPDGRIAFATHDGIEIYDGSDFSRHAAATGNSITLAGYSGYHHLYLSHDGRYLWVKNFNELKCIDLDTEMYSTDVAALLRRLGFTTPADDFFADTSGQIWTVAGNILSQPQLGITLSLNPGKGKLLDLATDKDHLYLFHRNGEISVYALPSGIFLYSKMAFSPDEIWKFGETSLVVNKPDGLYQIRNGALGGLFHFCPSTKKWTKLLESNLRLNTLAVGDSIAYISTNNGLLTVDCHSGKATHFPLVRTRSGNLLASEISTISIDREGGLWLGFLNRGIFYHHPRIYRYICIAKEKQSSLQAASPASIFSENPDGSVNICQPGLYLTVSSQSGKVVRSDIGNLHHGLTGEYGSGASFISSNGSVLFNEPDKFSVFLPDNSPASTSRHKPVISSILVNGERIMPLGSYGGNTILHNVPARTGSITLDPDQNFLTFEVSIPQFSSSQTIFHYKLEGIDREWNHAKGSGEFGRKLSAHYTALPPGDYTFKVRTADSGKAPTATLAVEILPHWWQTAWAYTAYVILTVIAMTVGIAVYGRHTKNRIAREQREEYLLLRIRNLIAEVDRYKAEQPKTVDAGNRESLSCADQSFITKAVEAVEKNLETPGYSVAQLSRDLCMDRTGLYRKLTALLDRSPSLFIRDIRLRHAAQLLLEGELSITEIAVRTGFSSSSHMSKCFLERYGCRPSEYSSLHDRES